MSANLSAEFLALQAQVAQTATVEQSAIVLMDGLSKLLAAALTAAKNGDTGALPALQKQLSDSGTALAASVVQNTPKSGGGGTPAAVPNVVGETLAVATAAIQQAGFALGNVATGDGSTQVPVVPSGSVISSSPPAGGSVPAGTAINVVVAS